MKPVRGLAVILFLGLAACSTDENPPSMPDVTGGQLDAALLELEAAGITDEAEIVGGGVFGVVDESNWQVCTQAPGPGDAVTSRPTLTVDRSCADVPSGSGR